MPFYVFVSNLSVNFPNALTYASSWLGQQFQAFDANGKQALSEKEVTALLRKMRISAPASIIRQKFQVRQIAAVVFHVLIW